MRKRLASIAIAVALVGPALIALTAVPASATAFPNAASITLSDPNSQSNGNNNATASPYPSAISVSGLTGTVSHVTATLSGATYSYSEDIDALLVGPTGASLVLVASMGPDGAPAQGNPALSNSTVTFSDSGTTPTASTPWGTGNTFKPANFGGFNEVWESPAPAPPYGNPGPDTTVGTAGATFASQFGGTNANGTWSLYVITTSAGDGTGAIAGGWSLDITTASAASTSTTPPRSARPPTRPSPRGATAP
jgi:hypothetical protein